LKLKLESRNLSLIPGISAIRVIYRYNFSDEFYHRVADLLNRLEIKGEPVWGLSSKERDLVRAARMKYKES
jgi:hypothetical protein